LRIVRQTREQIDHAIVDSAADIFATHGYAHTSVQQIADAVGYSKTGLLHRFASKQVLHDAVVREAGETVDRLVERVADITEESDRLERVVGVFVDEVFDQPGMVRLLLESFRVTSDDPRQHDLQELGLRLVSSLDLALGSVEGRTRVILAVQLVVNAAHVDFPGLGVDVGREDLKMLIVEMATDVLRARARVA